MKFKDIINKFCGRNKSDSYNDEAAIVIPVGYTLNFVGTEDGPVGMVWYHLEYDKEAFSEEIECIDLYKPRYEDFRLDESTGRYVFCEPDGHIENKNICRLTALKEGLYTIREINEFPGKIKKEVIHNVRVKKANPYAVQSLYFGDE